MVQIISADLIGNGNQVTLLNNATDRDATVLAGVTVTSLDGRGIFGQFSDHVVSVLGSVSGLLNGIQLGTGTIVTNNRIEVGATGTVSGGNGITIISQQASVLNDGTISGTGGQGVGVNFVTGAVGVGVSSLINNGDISGTVNGVGHGGGSEAFTLRNTGTITGGTASFRSTASGPDLITNKGLMQGNVFLGLGDDRYDGRGGQVIGTIRGDDGNDTFRPGAAADSMDGGIGTDVLTFTTLANITVSLSGSFANTRTAVGDSYIGIENVIGSANGNDKIGGNAVANTLSGKGGADQLLGEDGSDTLIGGGDIDTLTGGRHNDHFRFDKLSDCGDVITDFNAQIGDVDKIVMNAAAFGGGLVAGSVAAGQFITRSDNRAQDTDDRFIFNTVDRTLWFDRNGDAAGGLHLVCDLQAGATLLSGGLLLI